MTRWNPSGLSTNCGFCAIAYALEMQKGIPCNADELYEVTLKRLGIEKKGGKDPIPRMLIFPGPLLTQAKARGEYEELEGRGRGLEEYTIWAVAENAGLKLENGDRLLLNSLMEFAARIHTKWTLDDFVRARLERPELAGRASFPSMKSHVETSLKGNSIIGSTTAGHFMNMSFGLQGEWKLFDPQNGRQYDGSSLKSVLSDVDLFQRVKTAAPK